MKSGSEPEALMRWLQRHRRHILSVMLILFSGYIVADIVIGLLFPATVNSQGALGSVFAEMKFFGYWAKKLAFSVGGGVLYAALLWSIKPRALRES